MILAAVVAAAACGDDEAKPVDGRVPDAAVRDAGVADGPRDGGIVDAAEPDGPPPPVDARPDAPPPPVDARPDAPPPPVDARPDAPPPPVDAPPPPVDAPPEQTAFILQCLAPTCGRDWTVNGQSDPTLTLIRGHTYTFTNQTSQHPLAIHRTMNDRTAGDRWTEGVTPTTLPVVNGTLTFVVPMSAPATLYYNCEAHAQMSGALTITGP